MARWSGWISGMSIDTPPVVECERQHATLPVTDVVAAVDFYQRALGFAVGFVSGDPAEFAGVNLGDVQLFLRRGSPNPEGCSVYFVVGDADELYEYHRTRGVEVVEAPADRPYGLRDYHVRDLHGYHLGFGHYIYTTGEPIEIERVDLPVRLEKRLAALLADLAGVKRMSISSCLEETLLHTMDGAGPHTPAQLRRIQALKARHGIDFDTHASYRFVERPPETT
jgi:uncharacterized glyoxalase superfamily protein PhnB